MKKYVSIFWWNVLTEIKNGKKVFLIDKESADVTWIENISAGVFVRILKEVEENDTGRYEFYYIEEKEGAEDDNV